MTVTIDFAPEEEARLRAQAAERGQDVAGYLKSLALEQAAPPQEQESAGSAADLFKGHIGRIHGSTEALSEDTGKRFTDYLIEKHRAGRL